ncbi:MAG: hypothetical protein GY855_06305 [candidate division Zixibacteria bacterium]|nr:hypothetical protein [candidate division Zixibacteria bacterium]
MKKFMGLAVITVFMLVTVSGFYNPAECELLFTKNKRIEGRGYLMFGGLRMDIDDLNTHLKSAAMQGIVGYSEFKDDFFSIGGGGHVIFGKLIIGGEGHGLIRGNEKLGNYKTSLFGGYGLLNFGMTLISSGRFDIYPLVGIGGGGMRLKITERNSVSFGDVLDNPGRNSDMTTGCFLLHAALGFDHLVKLADTEFGTGGLVFGCRAGYIYAPYTSEWRMEGKEVSGGPETGITGPYFRILIGGGGYAKKFND